MVYAEHIQTLTHAVVARRHARTNTHTQARTHTQTHTGLNLILINNPNPLTELTLLLKHIIIIVGLCLTAASEGVFAKKTQVEGQPVFSTFSLD